jgi:hypothetical protein
MTVYGENREVGGKLAVSGGRKFHGKLSDKIEKFIASNPQNLDQLRTD